MRGTPDGASRPCPLGRIRPEPGPRAVEGAFHHGRVPVRAFHPRPSRDGLRQVAGIARDGLHVLPGVEQVQDGVMTDVAGGGGDGDHGSPPR